MTESDEIISIIDRRIEKFFQMYNISSKFSGKVISVDGNFATVHVTGNNVDMKFLNKSGSVLSPGDSVYIEAIGGNLTNGIIQYKFGE